MSTARLPIPGGDKGTWGDVLNNYLSTSLAADGTVSPGVIGATQLASNSVTTNALAPNSVTAAQIADNTITETAIADGSITEALLSSDVQTKLNSPVSATIGSGTITKAQLVTDVQTSLGKADTALQTAPVTSVATRTGDVVLTSTDVGLANVNNTSDANKPVSTAMQTALNLKANTASLATVATSGSYSDLSNKPTIPSVTAATTGAEGVVQLSGDLGGAGTTAAAPTLAATSNVTGIINTAIAANSTVTGALQKASNLSDLASASSARTNLGLATVASSGSYTDLSSKPTIPAAGTTAGTYAAGNDSRFAGSAAGTAGASLSATDASVTNSRTPTGTASGDLSGTFPSPTVAKVNGVTVSGTAASGTALVATSASAAAWTASATIDTTDIPQTLGTASPGTGSNGVSASDHVHAMPALSQLSDQDVTNLANGTIPTWNASAGKFQQLVPTLSSASAPLWQTLTLGITTLPRTYQADSGSFSSTPASGVEHFTFFRADKTMSVGHISFQTGGTAAATSTYAAVGLYTVSGSTLTLVASCANKTTFSGTYSGQSCALTAAYSVTSGVIYAVGMLQVATTPASVLGMWFNGAYLGSAQEMAGTLSAQATLSSSTSSISNQQFPIYYELTA